MAQVPTDVSSITKLSLGAGIVMMLAALFGGSWVLGLWAALLLVGGVAAQHAARRKRAATNEPWPWPPDFRAAAERLARPIDPTPRRLLPLPEKASLVATVPTTAEGLSRLIADKPAAWPWAVLASVMVQHRNAEAARLRTCVAGYQPGPGSPLTPQQYGVVVHGALGGIADLAGQLEQYVLSPAFTGAFGDGEDDADADAIVAVGHRLMGYHDDFLAHAETCLQTPVQSEALGLVADLGAFVLCPLIGFQRFIEEMCARIGEAQELLPYSKGGTVVALDNVNLAMSVPDGLLSRIVAQMNAIAESGPR